MCMYVYTPDNCVTKSSTINNDRQPYQSEEVVPDLENKTKV